jgi:hypothetical protein
MVSSIPVRSAMLLGGMLVALTGLASAKGANSASKYEIKGNELEGCECTSVCPCIWSADATADQCRTLVGWEITEGHYGTTKLDGLEFAATLTKSGKNVEKSMGTMEGVLYVPDSATLDQQAAIEAVVKSEMGGMFSKLDVKKASIKITGDLGNQELTVGSMGHLKVTARKAPNGKVMQILNAPGVMALPVENCAIADVNTYNDAGTNWDFAGHNAFYGAFEMKSKSQ